MSSVLASALLFACAPVSTAENASASSKSETASAVSASSNLSREDAPNLSDPADPDKESTSPFIITGSSDDAVAEQDGSVYTIRTAGEYTITGALEDGQIIVNAGEEDDVKLIFSDVSISCSFGAPVLILSASDVSIKADTGTYNTVTDLRTGDASALEDSDENYDAAIYSSCDLKINGNGTLIVSSTYDNGIKSKDDLSIKKVTLKVTASGNALKGNDSVEIQSGELLLISTESDGIKTVNSDISSKGNQRGTISILGGQVDIYAACDGISAAYNVEISEEDLPLLHLFPMKRPPFPNSI